MSTSLKRGLIAAAAYSGLAIVMTWPLATHLASAFPHDPYDPTLVTWILWWDAHTRPLTQTWWNAPIFWPLKGALALSEHLLGISILTAPLQWLGVTPVASYNVAFLVSFPLAALAFHALVVALTSRHDVAAVGALAFAFGPYRNAQVSHLQMLWTFGVPLALLALHRYDDTRQARWLAVFAVAWAVQGLSNGYLLLFFPVLLAMWALWYVRSARHLAAIGVAWLAGWLPLLPIVVQYERWQHTLALSRRYEEIQSYSADILSIVSAAPGATLWSHLLRGGQVEDQFFPGALVLILVGAGAVWDRGASAGPRGPAIRVLRVMVLIAALGCLLAAVSVVVPGPWALSLRGSVTLVSVTSPQKPLTLALLFSAIYLLSSGRAMRAWQRRSAVAFYLISALTTFVLALGPLPRFGGEPVLFHSLYWWLLQLPGYSSARVPARFGVLFELCIAVAAALALARITASGSRRARLGVVAVAAAVVIESWPAIPLAPLPPSLTIPFARGERAALLELPLDAVESETAALWRSMQHRLPIVNGYSGYEPAHYTALRLALDSGDERVLDSLARDRDLIVAVNRRQPERWSALVSRHPGATRIGGDPSWELFRIGQSPAPAGMSSSRSVPIAQVRTTDHPEEAAKLVDGTIETIWTTGKPQTGNEAVELDFGEAIHLIAVKIELGAAHSDFPRRLDVECATNPAEWQPCWSGSAAALAIDGIVANPRNATMTIAISADRVRWLRLRQTGSDPAYFWSIAELTAIAR